jgi:hypothetical protein
MVGTKLVSQTLYNLQSWHHHVLFLLLKIGYGYELFDYNC